MTELEEVAEAIHSKWKALWPITKEQARNLAEFELPLDETQNTIEGVVDALMAFNPTK